MADTKYRLIAEPAFQDTADTVVTFATVRDFARENPIVAVFGGLNPDGYIPAIGEIVTEAEPPESEGVAEYPGEVFAIDASGRGQWYAGSVLEKVEA